MPIILSAAKNLRALTQILRSAQNDRLDGLKMTGSMDSLDGKSTPVGLALLAPEGIHAAEQSFTPLRFAPASPQ